MRQAYTIAIGELEALQEALTSLRGQGFQFITSTTIRTAPEGKRDPHAMGALVDRVTLCIEPRKTSARSMINQINQPGAQINLIAPNVTIEAARAEQAGRGFAVITSEIRELSRKSKVAVGTLEGHLRREPNIPRSVNITYVFGSVLFPVRRPAGPRRLRDFRDP